MLFLFHFMGKKFFTERDQPSKMINSSLILMRSEQNLALDEMNSDISNFLFLENVLKLSHVIAVVQQECIEIEFKNSLKLLVCLTKFTKFQQGDCLKE